MPELNPTVRSAGAAAGWFTAERFGLVALGLMFAVPLVQPRHTNPLSSFYSEWTAFVLGCIALFSLVHSRYWQPLRLPRVALLPLLLVVVVAVQFVLKTPPYPQAYMLAAGYLIWAAALIILAFALREEFGIQRVSVFLAWCLLVSGCVNAFAALLQHYEWRGALAPLVARKLGEQVYGNLGQPNHFADAISMALASLTFLYSTGRLRVAVAAPTCAIMLFVVALSGSRSAWLFLLGVAVIGVIAHRRQKTRVSASIMHLSLAMLPGVLLAEWVSGLAWLAPNSEYTTGLDRMFALAGTSSERIQLWHAAWRMFMEHPVLGVGWDQFAWNNFMLATTLPGVDLKGLYGHAHNIVLHLLAVTGLVGAILLVVTMAFWIRGAWRLLDTPNGWWLHAAVLVLVVHSMLEYPLWNAYFAGIAAVLLGLGEARFFELRSAKVPRALHAVIMTAATIASVFYFGDYVTLEKTLSLRYTDGSRQAQIRTQEELFLLRRSLFAEPYVDLIYAGDMPLNAQGIQDKVAFTSRAMHFAPTGFVAYRYAALLALSGESGQANAILDRAVATYPRLLDDFAAEFEQAQTGNDKAWRAFRAALYSHLERRGPAIDDAPPDVRRH